MKGLDTNVIVRFPTQDGPGKSPVATRFILQECKSTEPGFINRVVPCELVWILDSAYRYRRDEVAVVMDRLRGRRGS